jgi:hypothetical protein
MIKKTLLLLSLMLVACKEKPPMGFNVLSPTNRHLAWEKHQDLPAFDPKIHSDGCSGGMSAIYEKLTFLHKNHGKTLKWRECCEIHDKAYYYGGSKIEKKQADMQLNQCVAEVVGQKYLGKAMQIAVEIGGGPNLPTPYRWGYGVDFKE